MGDWVANASEDMRDKWDGLSAIGRLAMNPQARAHLGNFLGKAYDQTTGTEFLMGGASFLGELALAVGTGGTSVIGNAAGASVGAILSSSSGMGLGEPEMLAVAKAPRWDRLLRDLPAVQNAMHQFGAITQYYRSAAEMIDIVVGTAGRVDNSVMMAAHQIAMGVPLSERAGTFYGHIRMAEQGFERIANFKLPGNQGLDGAYKRVVDGKEEFAVLESKSGRPSAGALGTANTFKQGSKDYIEDRLQEFLRLDHPTRQDKIVAQQFLRASRVGKVDSYLAFADNGLKNGKLLKLPELPINRLDDSAIKLLPWRTLGKGI